MITCKDCKYFSQELGGAYYDFKDGHCTLYTTDKHIEVINCGYGLCSYFEEADK